MSWPFHRATAAAFLLSRLTVAVMALLFSEPRPAVFIFPSRSLYRSLGRMNADRHRNEGYLFSLYLTFYPRLNCGTHPQFVLMKFSNAVAVGFTIVFSTGMVLPLRAAGPPSDTERLQNLEKAVRQLQERNAEQFDELLLRLQVLF